MERDDMPDAVDSPIALSGFRGGIIIVILSLLMETMMPRSASARQSLGESVSGSVTITQPLNRITPGNIAQYVVLDSSPSAVAPWAAVGLRWAFSDWGTHPIGALGLRWRRRSLRATLGVGRDAAYDSLSKSDRSGDGTDSIQPGYAMQPVTDVIGALQWNAGRVTIGGETGWRLAGPARRQLWYRADLSASLIRSLALVVGLDRRSDRAFSSNASPMTFGIQWTWTPPGRRPQAAATTPPRARAPASQSSSPLHGDRLVVHRMRDSVRIRLHLVSTNVSQVEVRGDLTDWTAVPMERSTDHVWQLALPASPGVHRLAVRVNGGAWLPPPGVPVGTDGYGGKVGLFTVEP